MPNDFKSMIIAEVTREGFQPRKSRELARDLNVSKKDYNDFRDMISTLKHQGSIVRLKGGRWGLPEKAQLIKGRISVTRAGNGFLLPDDPAMDDLYIGEDFLLTALNGDRVMVRVDAPKGKGYRQFGRVIEVLERATTRIVGTVMEDKTVRPEDPKNPFDYVIENVDDLPQADWKVLIEITYWPEGGEAGKGKMVEKLGPAGNPDTETMAILASFNAPGPFDEEVKEEARAAANIPMNYDDRLDLRKLTTYTIDPETARDFDDALSVEVREDGTRVIGVHIADVSHFVRPGSVLNEEARDRSTSIYLPGRVIPMLPEELSNDLCSLRPDEDRPAKTVFLHYDQKGKRIKYTIHRSIIRSKKRFAYKDAYTLLDNEEAGKNHEDQDIMKSLRELHKLAQQLREKRLSNGSIELNFVEYIVLMNDEGEACDIAEVEHDFSHQLVEEFMLAANSAVAEWAKINGVPVLHRVHDTPADDAVDELALFLTACGHSFKPPLRRDRLNMILQKVHGLPEEHSINLAILKSFRQAVYSPDPNLGHFALNFEHYLHFTSPIRRFPDLHLHQALDAAFTEGANKLPQKLRKIPKMEQKEMEALGNHTSGLERRAMKIEESVKDLRRMELIDKQDEKIFRAVVTGVRKFGIFLEIQKYCVEGMIPRKVLEQKGYAAREDIPGSNRGKKDNAPRRKNQRRDLPGFHLGQEVLVKIVKIDLSARLCEMELLEVYEREIDGSTKD